MELTPELKNDPEYKKALFDPMKAANFCIKKMMPVKELEPIISTNGQASANYATFCLKKPFPIGEAEIAKNPDAAYMYANFVLKFQFPLCHKYIVKNVRATYNYIKDLLDPDIDFAELNSMSEKQRLELLETLSNQKHKSYKEDTRYKIAQFDGQYALNFCKIYGPIPELLEVARIQGIRIKEEK